MKHELLIVTCMLLLFPFVIAEDNMCRGTENQDADHHVLSMTYERQFHPTVDDSCQGNTLHEVDCDTGNNQRVYLTFNCSQYGTTAHPVVCTDQLSGGMHVNGKCTPTTPCTDSEPYRDLYVTGEVTGVEPQSHTYYNQQPDTCADSGNVNELSCEPETGFIITTSWYDLWYGEDFNCLAFDTAYANCVAGRCVPTTCLDTDGGNDPTMRATSYSTQFQGYASDTYVTYTYDQYEGLFRTSITDELSSTTWQLTDALGRVAAVRDALQNWWHYAYDPEGRLRSVMPPGNAAITSYQYDPRGLLWRMHDPEKTVFNNWSNTDAYEYDAAGNLVQHTTILGTERREYDQLNRLTRITFDRDDPGYGPNPNPPTQPTRTLVRNYYDGAGSPCLFQNQYAIGKLCTSIRYLSHNGSGDIIQTSRTYGYDERGHVVAEIIRIATPLQALLTYHITYEYDNAGNLIEENVNGEKQYVLTYDNLSRVREVRLLPNDVRVADFNYTATGLLAGVTYGNAVQTAYAYTLQDFLHSVTTTGSFGGWERTYERDAVGNVVAVSDGNNAAAYTYDDLYRLTSAAGTYYPHGYTYTYDAQGNRLTSADGSTTLTYAYNTALSNKLLRTSSGMPTTAITTFDYDAHGSLIRQSSNGEVTTYTHEPYDDLLVAADTNQDGLDDVRYAYDDANRRIMKRTPSGYSLYVHDIFNNIVLIEEREMGP